MTRSNFAQLWQEIDALGETLRDRVHFLGSMAGNVRWAPSELIPVAGLVRDGDLGTIGGGKDFVEIQEVVEIRNPHLAYRSNLKVG